MYGMAWHLLAAGEPEKGEAVARRMIRAEPAGSDGYWYLATILATEGRSRDIVLEAMKQCWSRIGPTGTELGRTSDTLLLDVLYGDFASADRDVEKLDRLASGESDIYFHAQVATVRVLLAEEAGEKGRARDIAKSFLEKHDVWSPQRFFDEEPLIFDPVPFMLATELHDGALSAKLVEEGRESWLATWSTKIAARKTGFLWLYGYALPAATPEEARAALAVREKFGPLPLPVKFTWMAPAYEAHDGKVRLLAGRASDAIAPLERATASADVILYPAEAVRGQLWLGQAREALDDVSGACAAYTKVLARWGASLSRSVTARAASDRMTALRCTKK
jgi:hypothetical protein